MKDEATALEPISSKPQQSKPWDVASSATDPAGDLHQKPFQITHELASSPLFTIEALMEAARAAAKRPGDLYYDAGKVEVTDKWGKIPVPDMPVDEVLRRIKTAGAWVIIKHVEIDPRYKSVLDSFYHFVREIAGPLKRDEILNPEMLVIISSPGRITPFHFDGEINFLVQVHGAKEVWVCDPKDRSVISDADIEEYYTKTMNAGKYKPGTEAKAAHFTLHPGEGVHIPTHAAHWVRNGEDVSISLSLNFEFPKWKTDVHRMNSILRKFGLSPRKVGVAPGTDRIKGQAFDAIRRLKHLAKPQRPST